LSACGDDPAPRQAGGKDLYRTQACATCHGQDAQGTVSGPALARISQRWSLEELVEYFGEPEAVRELREDLLSMQGHYPARMPSYKHLSTDERERLARYLLTL
jgi:mono/diheme cytochrome c family protein